MFRRSQETMAQGRYGFGLVTFSFCISCIALVSLSGRVEAYQNYTVGGSLGWYDSQEKPEIDYQKWASGKNFSLGDFLSKLSHTRNNLKHPLFLLFVGVWFLVYTLELLVCFKSQ